MATYTSNINLKKPAQSDKIRIADFNGNADNIDAAIGADFGQGTKPSINQAINSLADGLAIIANGNVHAAITAGQFVYVRNHDTLSEGLYVASSNISANGTLSGSNLTADSSGGLNALNGKLTNIPNVITPIANYYGVIESTADFNSYLDSGVYTSIGTNNNPNKPAGVNDNGFLIVFRLSSSAVIQIWIGTYTGNIVYRKYNGSFGNWKTISAT